VGFEQVLSGHVTDLNGRYKFRVSEVKYQPGGYVGDHHHAGPGVRVIIAGEFTYVKGDKTTVYKAGDAFLRAGRCDASRLQSRKYHFEGHEH
jgi:quercetin dioxygenase-like cupin family protein